MGRGSRIGFLAGFGGLPRWIPFLSRLAEQREVIVPSLPGYPGATGHTLLDSHLDWLLVVRELLRKSGLEGAALAGSSVGGSFVAEVAALWPSYVKSIAVVAPFGLFDEKDPPTDIWAQKPDDVPGLLCANAQTYKDLKAPPPHANSVEWPIEQVRASEAAARAFWPLGNTRLEKRLSLIEAPTLLLWGEQDRIVPRAYADKIKAAVRGKCEIRLIKGAGHLAELDQPDDVAKAILEWTA
jgi:pimeloyl-ACP methyl ester carboxylesterase